MKHITQLLEFATERHGSKRQFNLANFAEALHAKWDYSGSTDGEYLATRLSHYPGLEVLRGGAHIYWHRGWYNRFKWWLSSTPCTNVWCQWRIRMVYVDGRSMHHVVCHRCLAKGRTEALLDAY
jgi:hypothetical protein